MGPWDAPGMPHPANPTPRTDALQPPDAEALPVELPYAGALKESDLRRLMTQQSINRFADIIIDFYLAWKQR